VRVSEDLDEDEEMVSLSQIAMQLVDWTDPRRLVDLSKTGVDLEGLEEEQSSTRNRNIHVDVAIAIMEQMKRASSTPPHGQIALVFEMETDWCRRGEEGVVQYARQTVYHFRCGGR
jgi:hypothetical protein